MFFEDILINLNKQIEYYSKILDLSSKEKQAILDEDINAVSMIVEQQKKLYSKAIVEEQKRMELISGSEQFSGKEDVALEDIINICTDAKKCEEIRQAKQKLVEVLQEQKYLDNVIDQLLSTNLEYYNFILTAVSSEVTLNNMYTNAGCEVEAGKGAVKIFDSEV